MQSWAQARSSANHCKGETLDAMTEHAHRIVAHNHCPNAKYTWHRVDGYCEECETNIESNDTITARRNAQGYR